MHVTLLAAQSLDGWITRHDEPGDGFTSPADKAHFLSRVRACDCWAMGAESYRASRERLTRPLSPTPRRVVLTRTPEAFAADAVANTLEFTAEEPAALVARLRGLGLQRCLLLGGGATNARFLRAGLVDEVVVTVEPRLFGAGTPLVAGAVDVPLKLLRCENLANTDALLLTYAVVR